MKKESLKHKEILVVQLARFGDFLQTTPLLAALKTKHPTARLTALVNAAQADLAGANPHVDEVLAVDLADLDRLARNKNIALGEKVRQMRDGVGFLGHRAFDLVINLNTSRVAALLSELVRAGGREGPRLGPNRRQLLTAPWAGFIMNLMSQRRLIRFNLVDLLASYADIKTLATDGLTYPLSRKAEEQAQRLWGPLPARPLIGLQLGSRHPSRQWPPEYFARLAQSLIEKNHAQVVLLGTEAEQPLGRLFLSHLDRTSPISSAAVIDLMGRTTIEGLGGVLAGLDLLVTTDTGTMHLAAAVKTPILALFIGPAFCHETGPYGPGHLILQVETDCSPCTEKEAECKDHFCRRLITPEAAALVAGLLLNKQEAPLPGPLELGPRVRLLVSEFDDFGVVYRPLVPYPLDQTEALALAYREAGRGFIRPAYNTNKKSFTRNAAAFLPPDRADIKRLAQILSEWEKLLPLNNSGSQALARLDMTAGTEPGLEPLRRIIFGLAARNQLHLARRLLMKMIETLSMVQKERLRTQTQGNDYCQKRVKSVACNRPV